MEASGKKAGLYTEAHPSFRNSLNENCLKINRDFYNKHCITRKYNLRELLLICHKRLCIFSIFDKSFFNDALHFYSSLYFVNFSKRTFSNA